MIHYNTVITGVEDNELTNPPTEQENRDGPHGNVTDDTASLYEGKNLKFFILNVGGLRSKLKFQDFLEEINQYDIVCLSEIKMDRIDIDAVKM